MLRFLKFAVLVVMTCCTLLVFGLVGNGMLRGYKAARAEAEASASPNATVSSQAAAGMPREIWLARLKPIEVAGQCDDSPVSRSLEGDNQTCRQIVEPQYERCTSGELFVIPPNIATATDAERYGALIGQCITALQMGGEHAQLFEEAIRIDRARHNR